MTSVKWLHISDLHRGCSGDSIRWAEMFAAFLKWLKDSEERLNFIIITGDLTFSGSQTQFDQMRVSIEQIWDAIGGPVPTFTVPGNHDLARPGSRSFMHQLADHYFDDGPASLRSGLKHSDPDTLSQLRALFSGYSTWDNAVIRPEQDEAGVIRSDGSLPGDFLASLDVGQVSVGIAGINSAYLHINDTRLSVALEPEQLSSASTTSLDDWSKKHHFSLLLLHHPPDWLHKLSKAELESSIAPPGRFAAVCFGHMHGTNAVTHQYGSAAQTRTLIQCPSLFGLEKYGQQHEERAFGFLMSELQIVHSGIDARLITKAMSIVRHVSGSSIVVPDNKQSIFETPIQLRKPSTVNAAKHTPPSPPTHRPVIPQKCDSPPAVTTWVGRASELSLLSEPDFSTIAITGIGGQGKSYLAAKLIHVLEKSADSIDVWDWRDCREQSDRLHSIITSQVIRFAGPELQRSSLAAATVADLVELLFKYIGRRKVVLVYDNVDSYVDGNTSLPILGLDHLLNRALSRHDHNCKIVLTCRPDFRLDHIAFLELPLQGLSLAESITLFRDRKVNTADKDVRELIRSANSMTNGHPLWLSLIAAQMRVRPSVARKVILAGLSAPDAPLPRTVLNPIWEKLSKTEVTVLRLLAEALRPHSAKEVKRASASKKLTLTACRDALEKLTRASLVTEAASSFGDTRHLLHPLVRQFVRQRYSMKERASIIGNLVVMFYDKKIALFSDSQIVNSSDRLRLVLEKAELLANATEYRAAVTSLRQAGFLARDGGLVEDYIRVATRVVNSLDLEEAVEQGYDGVHSLVSELSEALVHFGDGEGALELLEYYKDSIPPGSTFYVRLCNSRCYAHWVLQQFDDAIEWADRGTALLETAKFDTDIDCLHNRALALRDGGSWEDAMSLFLADAGLENEKDLRASWPDAELHGALYGNVGRCLARGGNHELALTFFVMSYSQLEATKDHFNLGYAQEWIGDSLAAKGENSLANHFFFAAKEHWVRRAPPQAERLELRLRKSGSSETTAEESQQAVKAWVKARLESI